MPANSEIVAAQTDGAVVGPVRVFLRAEAAAVLAFAVAAYARTDAGWTLFLATFLLPDVAMLGYLRGPRVGAAAYNLAHSYALALPVLAAALLRWPAAAPVALIWVAHIAFDRLAGYGLKYGTAFGDTHLGRVGRSAAR